MSVNWEAFVRALRTFIQGLLATGLVAAWEAAQSAMSSGTFNIRMVLTAAVLAFVTAAVTYVYNRINPRTPEKKPEA